MFIHNSISAIPAFFRFTDITEFMIGITTLYRWRMSQKNCLIGRRGNDVQHKKEKKTNRDMDYNNSSRRFKPLGSRIIALSIKCDSLTLRTESRKE